MALKIDVQIGQHFWASGAALNSKKTGLIVNLKPTRYTATALCSVKDEVWSIVGKSDLNRYQSINVFNTEEEALKNYHQALDRVKNHLNSQKKELDRLIDLFESYKTSGKKGQRNQSDIEI